MDWRKQVVELTLLRQQIHEADPKKLWEYRLPRVANTAQQIVEAEASLGEPFAPDHRAFLQVAGGWPAFYQAVDLLGASDFLGSELSTRAEKMLSYVEPIVFDQMGLAPSEVYPIAVSRNDLDLFVVARRATTIPGKVIWLAGGEIDRFDNFSQFFVSMIEYNRQELKEILSESNK